MKKKIFVSSWVFRLWSPQTEWTSSEGLFFLHDNTTEDTKCQEDTKSTRESKADPWVMH